MAHQRLAHSRNVIIARLVVLKQNGLAEKILEGYTKGLREFVDDVESADLPVAAFDLTQPVLRPADHGREGGLGQAPTATIERNAISDAQLVACTPHGEA